MTGIPHLLLLYFAASMSVEIRETHPPNGIMEHEVYVQPNWVRPGSVRGLHFGAPITYADLQVFVPTTANPTEDLDFMTGCKHHSAGTIPWATEGLIPLERDTFCGYEPDLPVAQIDRIMGWYLGNEMDCPNWENVSERQPVGVRTYYCDFRPR